MAKRPTSRPKPDDASTPAAPKPKRARAAAPKPEPPQPPEPVGASPDEPSVDDIRRRAYERYLERGGDHGMHFDDWLEAEKELKSKK